MTAPGVASETPANTDTGGGGIPTNLFTQQQLDHTAAQARRGALESFFKSVGIDKIPSAEEAQQIFSAAAEYQKQQAGQKGDVERLTGELATANEKAAKVPELELALRRAQLAGDAGLKSRYHKYVEGDDDDAIKASIEETLADVGGGGNGSGDGGETPPEDEQKPPAKKGTGGTPPAPNPQQGAGGGGKPKTSMSAGRDAYKAKHGEKE